MGGGSAPTVDVSSALASYQAGADVIEKQFPIALQQYAIGNDWARNESVQQYLDAQAKNYPISQTAIDSTNELRKWLGMAPLSKSAPIADQFRGIAQDFIGINDSGSSGYTTINNIADAMNHAETLTDPTQRAQAKASILNQINGAIGHLSNDMSYYASRSGKNRTQAENDQIAAGIIDPKYGTFQPLKDGQYQDRGTYGGFSYLAVATDQYHDTPNEQNTARVQQLLKQNTDAMSRLDTMKQQFADNYQETPDQAYTSAQIMQKLQETPGYQVQYQQGMQALERSAAAKGNLLSGNTQVAATQFGEDYATQAYQQQISNLSQLAGLTMPGQQAGVQMANQQGQTLANLALGYGSAAQNSIQDIAKARQSAFNMSGDAQLQAAMLNAQMKQQSSMANQAGMGQLAGSVLGMIL